MIHIEIPSVDISIEAKNYLELPKKMSGLYLFYNEHGELMYIGKSSDIRSSVSQHMSGKGSGVNTNEVCHNFKRVDYIMVECPMKREIYQTYMINTLKPPLNVDNVYTYRTGRYDDRYLTEEYKGKRDKELERMQKELDAAIDKMYI